MNIQQFIKFIGEDHPFKYENRSFESFYASRNVFIPVNKQEVLNNGTVSIADTANIVDRISFSINQNSLIKDDLAILDIIATNAFKRPIYFAVTCQPSKMQGLRDYMQLEGLALRLVPVNTKTDNTYSVVGSGRVNTEVIYKNVMERFRWGNFDKGDLFVDRSYLPSIQSHRLMFLRTTNTLLKEDKKDKAIAFIDKYFEAFPHKNFPYDYNALYFIEMYSQAGAYEKSKPHLQILAKETLDHLNFYFSLSDSDRTGNGSFEQDLSVTMSTMQGMLALVKQAGDETYLKELESMFGAYNAALEN
jgi:hypothetical protein